jgi:hypothetical protein
MTKNAKNAEKKIFWIEISEIKDHKKFKVKLKSKIIASFKLQFTRFQSNYNS